jgi:7-carboxy-7-deazaguanine synthase
VDDLLFQIALLPGANICITGGEPFMQPADHLADLVHGLLQRGHTIDVFTNGSFPFPEWIEDTNVCVIMDWKLKGSGEAETGLETRIVNASRLRYKDAIKFVIKDDNDFAEAKKHWEVMKDKCACRFYAGVAWNHLPEAMLVEKILDEDLPWSLNVQVHKYIWPGVEKGI